MTATTPFLNNEDMLGPLASRYVTVDSLPWKPTPCPGIDMKVLLEDKETGLLTALFRWQPGAELALHGHRRQLRLAPQRQPPHREIAQRRLGAVGVFEAQHLPARPRRRAAATLMIRNS